MPNISAHMIVAKEVAKILNISSADFIRGNLLPDIIDLDNSHHKIKSGVYLVPDTEYLKKKLDLNNYLYLGYYTHLLLDKHYLEDFMAVLYPNKNVFIDGLIYNDYDYLNNSLINRFKLNTNNLEKIIQNFDCKIIKVKLKYNIKCLKNNRIGPTSYLSLDTFSKFLIEVSKTISEEIKEYANKSN